MHKLCGVVLVTWLAPLAAQAGGLTAAILNIGGAREDESVRNSVLDTLATELGKQKNLKVITRREIESVLGLEKLKDTLGCTDSACLAEIGGALGVDRLLTGSLAHERGADGKDFFNLTLQWIDPKAATTLARESVTWEGGASGLYQLIPSTVLKLVRGIEAQAYRGKLSVTTDVAAARVLIDGSEIGRTPLMGPLTLPIGKATIEVLADDYEPYRAVAIVDKDKTTGQLVTLVAKPVKPIYTRWWFWTGAAVIVAGAAAGISAAVLTRKPGGNGPGTGTETGTDVASGRFTVPALPASLGGNR